MIMEREKDTRVSDKVTNIQSFKILLLIVITITITYSNYYYL